MTTPDDLTSTRTHAHRVTEASLIVGNEAAILGALEGRDREIEALRARVGWEVAERNREAGARNVATAVDLARIEARLNAVQAEMTQAQAARALRDFLNNAPTDIEGLIAEVRRLTDANAHLERLAAAWKLTAEQTEDEARAALATARLDGARAMREAALVECRKVSATSDARGAVGGTQRETDRADGARACWSRVDGLDPAAVVGSGS